MLRRVLLSSVTVLALAAAVSGGVAASSSQGVAVAAPAVGTAVTASVTASGRALEQAERTLQADALAQAATRRTQAAAAAKRAAVARQKASAERRVQAVRASRDRVRARLAARDPRAAARSLVAARGWGSAQFSCLDSLWRKESGWKHTADNPSSSAFGIPQALPGSKMASAGPDWRTNPVTQVRWGLGYIESRYGTPCAAWQHSRSNNWY